MMNKLKLLGSSSGKANNLTKGRSYSQISRHQCQCSCSSQIPSQDDRDYYQFLSLYHINRGGDYTTLYIYDTENCEREWRVLSWELRLDWSASITQLPNGELFCYGDNWYSGRTVIIDRSYEVRILPYGTPCHSSSALYFDSNIYCFGGYKNTQINFSRKFDLKNNRWIDLALLPEADFQCHSVIFNGNVLISGWYSKNLWLYSTEVDSFSIISYEFIAEKRKFLINVERLYLIEWAYYEGWIYESEDEYHWKKISKSGQSSMPHCQMYCLYNKRKIYIHAEYNYYQFDLKKKVLLEIKNIK